MLLWELNDLYLHSSSLNLDYSLITGVYKYFFLRMHLEKYEFLNTDTNQYVHFLPNLLG